MTNPNREHVTDGGSCWCEPTVEFVDGGHIVIHNKEKSLIRALAAIYRDHPDYQEAWG